MIADLQALVGNGGTDREYSDLATMTVGNASLCHESMVKKGLCAKALAYVHDNRYCNILPFDSNGVPISNGQSGKFRRCYFFQMQLALIPAIQGTYTLHITGYINASFVPLQNIPSEESIIIAQVIYYRV